jgi:hypothetical protein
MAIPSAHRLERDHLVPPVIVIHPTAPGLARTLFGMQRRGPYRARIGDNGVTRTTHRPTISPDVGGWDRSEAEREEREDVFFESA